MLSSTPSLPTHLPWIIHVTSSHPPTLIVCTKKESFRSTTHPRRCLVVLSSVMILSSVRCSIHLTLNIRRYIHSSADSIHFSSAFVSVQPPAPYLRTVHTSERTSFIFRYLFIPLSFQIGTLLVLFYRPFQFGF